MAGRKSKRKGTRTEILIVNLHQEMGVDARRMPLSGALGGELRGDVLVDGELRAEVKARGKGQGFRTVDQWLGENDLLFLRQDRCQPLVLMPWRVYSQLISGQRGQEKGAEDSGVTTVPASGGTQDDVS